MISVQDSSIALMSSDHTLGIYRTSVGFRVRVRIKISRNLFVKNVQVLREGTSDTNHRPFSNRGNQITAIKHNKIFNCSEPVTYHHGSRAT